MKRRSFFARLAGAVGLTALAPPKPKPVDAKLAATGKWAYFIDGDVTCAKWIELEDFKQITIDCPGGPIESSYAIWEKIKS